MSASPWAYLFGILLALPVWVLVGIFLMMIGRLALEWLTGDGSAPRVQVPGKGSATFKG